MTRAALIAQTPDMQDKTMRPDPQWLDAQYDNRRRVPDFAQHFAHWRAASVRAREQLSGRLDVGYLAGSDVTLDLFAPRRAEAPVLVFIHGGYWRSLDKADHSFVAVPFVQAGAMVVVPNYQLCPAVTIETIALQTAQALAWVHRHAAQHGGDAARCVVVGHSAGGHLAAMLLACDGKRLGADLPARLVQRAVSISGLFDLEPLRQTPFLQGDLQLTLAQVRRCSPAGYAAPRGASLHAVVGALESDEFLRQNRLVRERWGTAVVPVCETLPGRNHFTVLDDLVDPHALLHGRVLRLLGLMQ